MLDIKPQARVFLRVLDLLQLLNEERLRFVEVVGAEVFGDQFEFRQEA